MRDLLASEAMRSCCLLLLVGLLVATAAALRAPAASPGRRAAIFSAGSAVTSCLLSRPAFAGGAAAPSAVPAHRRPGLTLVRCPQTRTPTGRSRR